MEQKEMISFVKNYSEKDFDKIKIDWNGKHGNDFFDKNMDFRMKVCELIKNDFSFCSDKIILDLYTELAKSSEQTFGVYNSFHLFANELLERGGVKYFDIYLKGLSKNMDTFLSSSSQLNLTNGRINEIVNYIKDKLKNSELESKKEGYDLMLKRFTFLAKEKNVYNYTQEDLFQNLKEYTTCKDYTVSKETYSVLLNSEFDLLVTQPVPENLEKYYQSEDYISHTDSKKSLFDKIYQIIRNYTLKQKLRLVNSFKTEEKTLLDIGAGTGDFLATCKNNAWKVSGVEPSKEAREIALKKGIDLQEEISAYTNQQFDVITMWHVLEHVPNLIEYTNQLKQLLKPNGVLVIAVPNFKSYDAQHYKNYWAAFDVPRHLWHFSKISIQKLFALVEMKVERVLPMKFDAFYVSLLSEKYQSGKMKLIATFMTGLRSNMKAKRSGEYSSLIYIIKNE